MELKLRNGEYVADDSGALARAEGTAELLQRALFLLTCRRGAFAFLPEMGSRLYTLAGEKPQARRALARQYCAEALAPLGLTVDDVTITQENDGAAALFVSLRCDGEEYALEVSI